MAKTTKKKEQVPAEEIGSPAAEEKKVYTADEVQALLAQMQAQIDALKSASAPSEAKAPAKERVTFRWQAPVSADNVLEIGPGGRWATITGPEQTFSVPKEELGNVLTAQVRHLLDLRWLIVLSGLDEDEMEAIGCNYRKGEILDRKAFQNLIGLGMGIVPIYGELCRGNRQIVAKELYEAWTGSRKGSVRRDVVVALKELDPDESAFRTILTEMNELDAK